MENDLLDLISSPLSWSLGVFRSGVTHSHTPLPVPPPSPGLTGSSLPTIHGVLGPSVHP